MKYKIDRIYVIGNASWHSRESMRKEEVRVRGSMKYREVGDANRSWHLCSWPVLPNLTACWSLLLSWTRDLCGPSSGSSSILQAPRHQATHYYTHSVACHMKHVDRKRTFRIFSKIRDTGRGRATSVGMHIHLILKYLCVDAVGNVPVWNLQRDGQMKRWASTSIPHTLHNVHRIQLIFPRIRRCALGQTRQGDYSMICSTRKQPSCHVVVAPTLSDIRIYL